MNSCQQRPSGARSLYFANSRRRAGPTHPRIDRSWPGPRRLAGTKGTICPRKVGVAVVPVIFCVWHRGTTARGLNFEVTTTGAQEAPQGA